MKLDLSNHGLTTLQGIDFPYEITELDCSNNQLTSLQYCPEWIKKLDCSNKSTNIFTILSRKSTRIIL